MSLLSDQLTPLDVDIDLHGNDPFTVPTVRMSFASSDQQGAVALLLARLGIPLIVLSTVHYSITSKLGGGWSTAYIVDVAGRVGLSPPGPDLIQRPIIDPKFIYGSP